MSTKDENQNEGSQALQLRWYCLSANGMATLALDKADAENVAAESDQLYPRNGPHVAVQMVPVRPDGRGTDAQIEKERDIARHAIVGAIAFGHAGNAHPGADHWLAAAHDAGATIARLERASHQVGGCQGDELKSMRHHFSPHAGQGGTPYDSEWASSAARTGQPPLACLSHPAESDLQQGLSITGEQPAAAGVSLPQRPECFDFAMDFLSDPEAPQVIAYVEQLERAILALRPAQQAADTDVRTILLDVVPGPDGMGREIYAKSVDDVVAKLAELAEQVETLRSELDDMTAARDEALHAPWPEWAEKIKARVRESSGYDGFDDQDGVDLPEEVNEHLSEIERQNEALREQLASVRSQSAQQAVPMTIEQIRAMLTEAGYDDDIDEARGDFINGARHAEAFHRIGINAQGAQEGV